VRVIHRRDELRAGETLKKRALGNEKMSFIWDTVVEEIHGDGKVTAVRLRNLKTGKEDRLATDGVFIYIGHYPNSEPFRGQLAMDERGYLITDKRMMTSVAGVFAAGEIQDPVFRQVATSVGQGAAAGMMAERWLEERG
jgi:thioredoxin reductase (NADPH)